MNLGAREPIALEVPVKLSVQMMTASQPSAPPPEPEVSLPEPKEEVPTPKPKSVQQKRRRHRAKKPPPKRKPRPPSPSPQTESTPKVPTPPSPKIAEVKTKSPAPKPAAPTVNLGAYWAGFRRMVESHKHYPRMARRLRLEGLVKVRVTVNQKGQIVGMPKVVESSGHDVLDKEALRMLEAAQASGFFVPLPNGWTSATASVVLPIEFLLRG